MKTQLGNSRICRRDWGMILIIAVMMLSSVNFMCNISDLYEVHVAEEEQKAAAQVASAHMMCAVPVISLNAARAAASYAAYKEENRWKGPVLSKRRGVIHGPSGKETYYNLNMSVVVRSMQRMGYDYEYWVRDDGVKMLGDYVMIAANLNLRPKGSIVETSLGPGIVCDTGGFAKRNPTQIDIATTW